MFFIFIQYNEFNDSFYTKYYKITTISRKLLSFAHGIKTNARSPLELRSLINSAVTPDVQTEENILPVFGSFELRGRRVEKSVGLGKFYFCKRNYPSNCCSFCPFASCAFSACCLSLTVFILFSFNSFSSCSFLDINSLTDSSN